jgi:hypothetical protein
MEKKETDIAFINGNNTGRIITSDEIHADLHKNINENLKLLADGLFTLSKIMEHANFAVNSLNEQREINNHVSRFKRIVRKLKNNANHEV